MSQFNQMHAVKEDDTYHHSVMHARMVCAAHTTVVHVCAVCDVVMHVLIMTVIHVAMIHQSGTLQSHSSSHCQQTTPTAHFNIVSCSEIQLNTDKKIVIFLPHLKS